MKMAWPANSEKVRTAGIEDIAPKEMKLST